MRVHVKHTLQHLWPVDILYYLCDQGIELASLPACLAVSQDLGNRLRVSRWKHRSVWRKYYARSPCHVLLNRLSELNPESAICSISSALHRVYWAHWEKMLVQILWAIAQ